MKDGNGTGGIAWMKMEIFLICRDCQASMMKLFQTLNAQVTSAQLRIGSMKDLSGTPVDIGAWAGQLI